MKVDVEVLKKAIARQLDAIAAKRTEIEIPDDLYWFVPVDEWADPTKTPTGCTLGSVNDDWEQVAAIGNGTREPTDYSIIWSAGVLRAIGNTTIP